MLDDGVPYKTIIEKLGEPVKHLNKDSISNWRLGGYQDHLKAVLINDRARAQTERVARAQAERAASRLERMESITQVAFHHLSVDEPVLGELLTRVREALGTDIAAVYRLCAFLPLLGLFTWFLPKIERPRMR